MEFECRETLKMILLFPFTDKFAKLLAIYLIPSVSNVALWMDAVWNKLFSVQTFAPPPLSLRNVYFSSVFRFGATKQDKAVDFFVFKEKHSFKKEENSSFRNSGPATLLHPIRGHRNFLLVEIREYKEASTKIQIGDVRVRARFIGISS